MSMISFWLFGLLAAVFCLLYIYDRLKIDNALRHRLNNLTLIVAGLVFVAYANILSAAVLTVITVAAWYFAKNRKYWYIGVILSVLTLGVFKYTNFVVSSTTEVFGKTGTTLNILLPVGISFFTFSAVSYIVDVHRGELEARSLEDVAAYVTFFPKLTSGPIQRGGDFFAQSDRRRNVGLATFKSASIVSFRILMSSGLYWLSSGSSAKVSTRAMQYQPMERLQKCLESPVTLSAHGCCLASS